MRSSFDVDTKQKHAITDIVPREQSACIDPINAMSQSTQRTKCLQCPVIIEDEYENGFRPNQRHRSSSVPSIPADFEEDLECEHTLFHEAILELSSDTTASAMDSSIKRTQSMPTKSGALRWSQSMRSQGGSSSASPALRWHLGRHRGFLCFSDFMFLF